MIDEKAARARLEARLRALSTRTDRIERDRRVLRDPDSEERVTESENDEVLEGLDDVERSELERVRHALARLESGTYATCEGCGGEIPPARLEVLPDAVRCVACA